MDVGSAITRDHHEIRELVDGLCGPGADAEFFLAQLRLRLAAHGAATETHVYAPLLELDPDGSELIAARVDGHRGLESQLAEVELAVGTDEFEAVRRRLRDNVAAEFDLEEDTVLPLLEHWTDETSRRTGHEFDLRRLAELDARAPGGTASGTTQEPTG